MLESRGAAGSQLFTVYLVQSLLLAVAALALGPPLALVIVRFLGAANGFLEFVGRTTLRAQIGLRAYWFALAGAGIFLAATLLPATRAARTSIVELRGRGARARRYTFWRRYYLDLVLIGIAIYGLVQFQQRREILLLTAATGSDLPLDPLLFLTSVVFILGSAMLALRLFPMLVQALFRSARRRWSPPFYAAFIQVARARGHEQFLMVFLILTLALGIYNSSARAHRQPQHRGAHLLRRRGRPHAAALLSQRRAEPRARRRSGTRRPRGRAGFQLLVGPVPRAPLSSVHRAAGVAADHPRAAPAAGAGVAAGQPAYHGGNDGDRARGVRQGGVVPP